jgi:SAUR family protein
MQGEEKKGKVKKGWLAVRVGAGEGGGFDESRRFVIPIAYLYHPQFRRLLEAARDAYGYDYSAGPLRLPCSVDEFLRLRALVERDTQAGSSSASSHRVHAGGHGHNHIYSSPCTRAKVSS